MASMQTCTPQQHLLGLYKLAKHVVQQRGSPPMNPFSDLYRNQEQKIWDKIKMEGGTIPRIIKDPFGSGNNPINRELAGIFFTANVDNNTGQPPHSSPYGKVRFQVPIEDLLDDIQPCNLYFSDYYQLRGGQHYVVIVMCQDSSDADIFCRANLLPLPDDNPFFDISSSVYQVSSIVWVEIFYTKEIDMNKMGTLH